MELKYEYEKRFLTNASYDDYVVKTKIVEVSEEILGFKTKINEKEKDIDLISLHDPNLRIEVERGGWFGDFWSDPYYSNLSSLGFQTLNMPDRKLRYWMEYYYQSKMSTELTYNSGWEKTIFVRTNWDFTQINIVNPETILNPTKSHRCRFKAKNNENEEGWVSFKREDVKTLNLINGKYVLDTEENGEYVPLTKYKIEELTLEKQKQTLNIEEKKLERSKKVYHERKERYIRKTQNHLNLDKIRKKHLQPKDNN